MAKRISNNIRLQKYKKNRISGMSKYNAALAAGYSKTTATAAGKILDERAKIEDVMERRGLTDNFLADKLAELIEAKDVIFQKNDDGNLEIIGTANLYRPNWSARSKGLEMAFKLKKLDQSEAVQAGSIKNAIQIVFIDKNKKQESEPKTEESIASCQFVNSRQSSNQ